MPRPRLAACLIALALWAAPVAAQSGSPVQDAIVAQLTAQGFTQIRVSTTLLGRVRIIAVSPTYTREIIFNPRTGEILRDYWDDEADDDDAVVLSSPRSGATGSNTGSGSGSDDDDRDESDDDQDDDRDDDKDDDKNDDKDDSGDDD